MYTAEHQAVRWESLQMSSRLTWTSCSAAWQVHTKVCLLVGYWNFIHKLRAQVWVLCWNTAGMWHVLTWSYKVMLIPGVHVYICKAMTSGVAGVIPFILENNTNFLQKGLRCRDGIKSRDHCIVQILYPKDVQKIYSQLQDFIKTIHMLISWLGIYGCCCST